MSLRIRPRARDDSWCRAYDARLISDVSPNLNQEPYIHKTPFYNKERQSWPLEYSNDRLSTLGLTLVKDKVIERRAFAFISPSQCLTSMIVSVEKRSHNLAKRLDYLRRSGRFKHDIKQVFLDHLIAKWPVYMPFNEDGQRMEFSGTPTLPSKIAPAESVPVPVVPHPRIRPKTELLKGFTGFPGRRSHARDSGPMARWSHRISATTVGGFAGGGVPRRSRDDPFAPDLTEWSPRFGVPAELSDAAGRHRIEPHKLESAVRRQHEKGEEDLSEPYLDSEEGRLRTPRDRTICRTRNSRFGRVPTSSKSKLRNYRRIHGRKSLLAPAQHSCQVTFANMDLVWSTASSVVSSAPSVTDTNSEDWLEEEEERMKWELAAMQERAVEPPSKKSPSPYPPPPIDEPTGSLGASAGSLQVRPPPPFTQTIKLADDEHNNGPPSGLTSPPDPDGPPPLPDLSTPQFRPPWAFPLNDSEAEAEASSSLVDPPPWPEPDHRYTHLGPGRGKATRHLEAVSQIGFAGGGLRRPRASDELPPLLMAGGGTVGRVMDVPPGLAAAAEEQARKARESKEMKEKMVEETIGNAAVVVKDKEKNAEHAKGTMDTSGENVTVISQEVKDNAAGRETKEERKARMTEKLFRQLREAESEPKGRKIARVSKTRDSGHNSRWTRRLSVTTVSGFAGGGVPRPARDLVPNMGDDAWVGWKGKTKVPDGLIRAAERREEKAPVEAKWEDPAEVSWPLKTDDRIRKEEWNAKWSNGEEGYLAEMASREFEVIEPVPAEETDQEMRRCYETEELTAEKMKIMKRADGMSKYEVILSAALFILAVLYAWELRSRYTA